MEPEGVAMERTGGYLDTAVERVVLGEHVGKSGAALERVWLPDGRRLIVKRQSAESDFMMEATGERVGREYLLWSRGILDTLPDGVQHAVVDGWVEDDVTVIVMRDLGDAVLTWDNRLSRETCRWVFGSMATMYNRFLDQPPDDLTPLPGLLTMFSVDRVAPLVNGPNPLAALTVRGWEHFADMVKPDLADAVLSLLADPQPLVAALRDRPCTLIHGDMATVNMAIADGSLILLDWALPAAAPAAVDVARFLAGCWSVVDASREQILADFAELSGPAYDGTALRLAMVSGLLWLGWNKALDAAEHPDPAIRERERRDLQWWLDQARTTLDAGLI
ncbi:MAG: hypothetical protein ACRDOY_08915 [Nocardioidaceae bacterium]